MSWVALDRGLRLADKRSFPADRARWLKVRDEIYEQVMSQGWNADRKAFVQSYGSDSLDASILLMPLVFFMAPSDPRMLSTVDAIRRSVAAGGLADDGMVDRYVLVVLNVIFSASVLGSPGIFFSCAKTSAEAKRHNNATPNTSGM